jgi:hypothetical protein
MMYAVGMASGGMIYKPSFMMTRSDNQVVSGGYYLQNLKDFSVGITDGWDLRSRP